MITATPRQRNGSSGINRIEMMWRFCPSGRRLWRLIGQCHHGRLRNATHPPKPPLTRRRRCQPSLTEPFSRLRSPSSMHQPRYHSPHSIPVPVDPRLAKVWSPSRRLAPYALKAARSPAFCPPRTRPSSSAAPAHPSRLTSPPDQPRRLQGSPLASSCQALVPREAFLFLGSSSQHLQQPGCARSFPVGRCGWTREGRGR